MIRAKLFWAAILLLIVSAMALGDFLPYSFIGFSPGSAIALDLTEGDCRCCHDTGVPDRHHALVPRANYQCTDCHEMVWNAVLQQYEPTVVRDCLLCHVASLADRHHISAQNNNAECMSCHALVWDDATQSYFIQFTNNCQVSVPADDQVTAQSTDPNSGQTGDQVSAQAVNHYDVHTVGASADCIACHQQNLIDEHTLPTGDQRCVLCHNSNILQVQDALAQRNLDCIACHVAVPHNNYCGQGNGNDTIFLPINEAEWDYDDGEAELEIEVDNINGNSNGTRLYFMYSETGSEVYPLSWDYEDKSWEFEAEGLPYADGATVTVWSEDGNGTIQDIVCSQHVTLEGGYWQDDSDWAYDSESDSEDDSD